jgi:hypothetical protein
LEEATLGYNTDFTGAATITPPLNPHEIDYLRRFAETCHMHRTKGPYVVECIAHTGPPPMCPPDFAADWSDIIDTGQPPPGLTDLWCKWEPTADGAAIAWNGVEKFYEAEHWLAYLVDTFLKPDAAVARERDYPVPGWAYPAALSEFTFDHVVNGVIEAEGEWPDDRWRIEVRDNTVYVVRLRTDPGFFTCRYPGDRPWGAEQLAEFEARTPTRHNFVYLVYDGQLHEVGSADGTAFAPIPAHSA